MKVLAILGMFVCMGAAAQVSVVNTPAALNTPIEQTINKFGFSMMTSTDQTKILGSAMNPPNSCAAVGPSHVVQISMNMLSVFTRTGSYVTSYKLSEVFKTGEYPQNGTYDVRILYDRIRKKYVAAALDRGYPRLSNNSIMVATSTDPTLGWSANVLKVGELGKVLDFLTLGYDINGYYFGAGVYPAGYSGTWESARCVVATPDLKTWWKFIDKRYLTGSPFPATALDDLPSSWFMSADMGRLSCSLRRVTWAAGIPTLELPVTIKPKEIAYVPIIQALGSLPLDPNDHRIQAVVAKGGKLYSARHIGIADTGTCGIAVYTVNLSGATLESENRIFSKSMNYFAPGLGVDGSGTIVIGCTGSSSTTYPSAYIISGGDPVLVKEGVAGFIWPDGNKRNRWGDFNTVAIDPFGMPWAFVEYTSATNSWAVWGWRGTVPQPPIQIVATDVVGSLGQNVMLQASTIAGTSVVFNIGDTKLTALANSSGLAKVEYSMNASTPSVYTVTAGATISNAAKITIVSRARTALISYGGTGISGDQIKLYSFVYNYFPSGVLLPLEGKMVMLELAGQKYSVKSEPNGRCVFLVTLPAIGTYKAKVNFAGDSSFLPSSAEVGVVSK